jgi:hypothetical protein
MIWGFFGGKGGGGARSSSVLIVEDCGDLHLFSLFYDRVVSLTFTPYLSFNKKIITSRKISYPFMYK